MIMQKIFRLNIIIALITFLIIIVTALVSCTQTDERDHDNVNTAELFPEKIAGWRTSGDLESYDRDGIFKYMDGAGEVYRMYDFRQVCVRQYRNPDQPPITVEIFDMGKAGDAYGIFLHSSQGGEAEIGQGSEFIGGILAVWQDRFYINIYPEKLTPEAESAAREIGQAIVQTIGQSGPRPKLVEVLPRAGMIPGSLKYFHLHTSLNYHYYLADQNILNLNNQTEAVMARYQDGLVYVVCIAYPAALPALAARDDFLKNYLLEADDNGVAEIQKGDWTGVKCHNNYLILIFEAPERSMAISLLSRIIDNLP